MSQAQTTTDAELDDATAKVQTVLEDVLTDFAVDDPADAERLRRRLPTDPLAAEMTAAALEGTPIGDALEYVHPSDRQDGYWRRSRERSDPSALSDAELRQRLAFVKAAQDTQGENGTVTTPDGRQIPKTAAAMRDALGGESFAGKRRRSVRQRAVALYERLRQAVGR